MHKIYLLLISSLIFSSCGSIATDNIVDPIVVKSEAISVTKVKVVNDRVIQTVCHDGYAFAIFSPSIYLDSGGSAVRFPELDANC